MRLPVNTFLVFLFLLASVEAYGFVNSPESVNNISKELILGRTLGANSVDDFLALTPREIKKRTGKKLTLKEVIVLKAAQKKIKKTLQQEGAADGEPKSQMVALLLAILIGVLGIHRFYLGYTTIGILQIITLGGCGIWALIDMIRIATGDLKPADGSEYDPKL